MAADDELLTPWYMPGKEYDYGMESKSRNFEEYFGEKKSVPKPVQINPEPTPYAEPKPAVEIRTIRDKHTPYVWGSASNGKTLALAEFAVAMRRALRGDASFSMRNNGMQTVCGEWFVAKKQEGLHDVLLVFGYLFDDPKAVVGMEPAVIICWFMDGRITRVTFNRNEKGLYVDEKPIELGGWNAPQFTEPYVDLRAALLDMASLARQCTPTDYWPDMFMSAVHVIDSENCEYDKQPNLFYLPKPYFKYLMAVQMTYLGMGMGSWYDLPMVGEKDFKLATHEFEFQKYRALLFAVNNN